MDKNYYQDEEFEEFEELEEFEQEYGDDEETFEFEEKRNENGKSGRLKIVATVLVIVAVGLAAVIYGFRLDEVRVIGNKNYTAEEIKTLIGFPENTPNTLFCYLKYGRYKVKDIPFLKDIHVKIENRNILCIEVDETNILACLKEGKKYYYFDDNGVVQEVLSELRATVPLVEGIDAQELELEQQILVEDQTIYKGMLELSQLLLDHSINAQKIEVDEEGYFTVYINDVIRVGLGAPVLLEEKTAEMANILPELANMQETEQIQGILHLENYDSTKNSIVFTKEN